MPPKSGQGVKENSSKREPWAHGFTDSQFAAEHIGRNRTASAELRSYPLCSARRHPTGLSAVGPHLPGLAGAEALYEVAIRPIYFLKHEPFIAAVVDVRTTRIIDRTVAELVQDSFSPVGHYVTSRVHKHQDPRIARHAELVGRVLSVNGTTLSLSDSRDEMSSIEAQEVWLEKRAFTACLALCLPRSRHVDNYTSGKSAR